MESAVELNRLLLKFLILCYVDIQESSREDNQKQLPAVFLKISHISQEDSCVWVSFQ